MHIELVSVNVESAATVFLRKELADAVADVVSSAPIVGAQAHWVAVQPVETGLQTGYRVAVKNDVTDEEFEFVRVVVDGNTVAQRGEG